VVPTAGRIGEVVNVAKPEDEATAAGVITSPTVDAAPERRTPLPVLIEDDGRGAGLAWVTSEGPPLVEPPANVF
jgi:hypothetical protein